MHAGLRIGGARRIDDASRRPGGGLRSAARRLLRQQRQRLRHRVVQARGTETATDHQQAQRAVATGKALRRRGQRARCPRAPDCRSCAHCARGGNADGKAVSTSRASGARQRLVKPAMAFCSWISSGRRHSQAATPPGPVTKPPRPTTTAGRCRRMMASACHSARSRLERRRQQRGARPCRAGRPPRATRSGNLSAGTTRASRPRRVPSQITSRERRAQQPRQRQRGKHMSAGAAGHDEHRAGSCRTFRGHAPRLAGRTARRATMTSWYMRSTMPNQASVTSRLLRP